MTSFIMVTPKRLASECIVTPLPSHCKTKELCSNGAKNSRKSSKQLAFQQCHHTQQYTSPFPMEKGLIYHQTHPHDIKQNRLLIYECCCHVIRPTLLKVRLKFIFVPLFDYKRRYCCIVFGVGKLSYYPTCIINGKHEFYNKNVAGYCLAVFQLLAENDATLVFDDNQCKSLLVKLVID